MKKITLSIVLFSMLFLTALSSYSRPAYLTLRLGFFAKWEITLGECEDGNGVCLAIGNPSNPDNAALGYDEVAGNVLFIRVAKSSDVASHFASGKFELKEDSPINPDIIKQLTNMKVPRNKYVHLKSGVYPISSDAEFYLVKIPYYLK